jgi:hypothetical protein
MIAMPAVTMIPMFLKNKKLVYTATVLALTLANTADAQPELAMPASESAAVYYAKQAGTVGGAAAGCDQASVVVFNNRSAEVIDVLAKDAQDKAAANSVFAAIEQSKQQEQGAFASPALCSEIIANLNNLPLMKADYRASVLAVLQKSTAMPGTPVTPVGTPSGLPNATLSYTAGQAAPAAPQANSVNPIFPALAVPSIAPNPAVRQNYVGGNPQANIAPANLPPYTKAVNPQAVVANTNATDAEKLKVIAQLTQVLQSLSSNNSNTQNALPSSQQLPGQ